MVIMDSKLQSLIDAIYISKLTIGVFAGNIFWRLLSMHLLLFDKMENRALIAVKSFFIVVFLVLFTLSPDNLRYIGFQFTSYYLVIYLFEKFTSDGEL